MKNFYLVLISILLMNSDLFGQASCNGAAPFCTSTGVSFPASTNTTAQSGADYDCLLTQPNPAWYYLNIATSGNIMINLSNSANVDIDFIIWGPFASQGAMCTAIFNQSASVVDCSYSTAANEQVDINNAVAGQWYMLLITNYANVPTNISASAGNAAGTDGTTNCAILCTLTGMTATPGACNTATNTYNMSGTISVTNPPTTGTLTITNSCSGTPITMNPPFGTSINYSFNNLTPTGGNCSVTATFSADPTCTWTQNYTSPAPCASSCFMNNLNVNIGACQAATTTYSVTGTVQFTSPPATGQLIIQTCGGNQTAINPPFTSPTNFTISNVPADGTANCNVTAYFTASPACSLSVGPYTEPVCLCNMDLLDVTINPCDPATNDYSIDFILNYTSPPSTGQLVISNCSGDQVTFNPPFGSTVSGTISGINSDGTPNCTVTAYFTADPACTITSPTFTEPASCACPANAGNITATLTGSGINNYILCEDDQIDLTISGFTYPNDVGVINGSPYSPGVGFLIYSCPPTVGMDPISDPCLQGAVSPVSTAFFDINDPASWFAAFPAGTFTNNTMYYVPFTFYDAPNLVYNANCWDLGTPIAVTYLAPVTSSGVENCSAGTVTVTVSGGYPALFGGNFTASGLSPATATFNNTTTTNNGTITISGLQDGQNYSFTITDANGCPHTFSGGPFNGPDIPVITPAGPFCLGDPAVNLVSTFPGGTWSGTGTTAAGNFNPATAGSGTHTIIYQAPGCGSSDTIQIVVNSSFDATINPAGPFCQQNPNTFLAAADPGGSWSGNGIVNASTGEFSPSVAGPGNHTITYSIPGSCGDTQTTTIQVIANADATINPAGPFCITDPAVNLTSAQTGGVWSGTGITNAANGTFNPSAAGIGTFTITYSISGVCGDSQTTNIQVIDTANTDIVPVGPFCVDDPSVNLVAASPGGTFSGTGVTTAGTFTPSVAGPGTHTITYTITGGCGNSSSTQIIVNPLPAVTMTVDNAAGCTPVSATITNTTNPVGTNCVWEVNGVPVSAGCNSFSNTFTTPGCYDITLTTTDNNGCTNSSTVQDMICVYADPIADFVFSPVNATVLNPTVYFSNASSGASTYLWDFGGGLGTSTAVNPTFTFPSDSANIYPVCLTATSVNGCVDDTCYFVSIFDEFLVYVPNSFTPDDDDINDIFSPIVSGHDPLSYELYIFNRWGELIFESHSNDVGWDGMHKGLPAKQDVYVWKLKVKKLSNGEKKEYYGHVTLLK